MGDYIKRADAIEAVLGLAQLNGRVPTDSVIFQIKALPSADAVSREQYDHVCEEYNRLVHKAVCVKLCDENCEYAKGKTCYYAREHYAIDSVLSADAEPKWNCTANFVAEQLDRLRKMTDEEKWEFFRKFFCMGDAVQGEWIVREYCTNELDYRRWIEIECPFCGERPTYEDLDSMNFCPNCGARMYKGGDTE